MTRWRGGSRQAGSLPHGVSLQIRDLERAADSVVLVLAELSTVLVKARIARGWTQRQLAEALGMAEQQIQRYEANDYRSTSLARLCDIANALGVTVAQHAELKPSAAWDDGRPETELNFKFYRQATNKIVGISDRAAAFLRTHF